tara:strand:- start:125 stop:541 length:417 start_codon:yes stop_codon:yes gene_type:complete
MRILFLLLLTISFDTFAEIPEPGYGLPELASEEKIRELKTKKRAKVLSQSTARKVTRVVEALDEAGVAEQEKALLVKAKKNKEAKEKDKIIDAAIRKGQTELDEIKVRLDSLKSYDRSMYFYYQSYFISPTKMTFLVP